MGWIAQVAGSFTKWWESAPTNQPFSYTMLTHDQRQLIHEDFVKATDFLGITYRAYEQLINMDPSNRLDHITSQDMALEKVRNCFKCIEMCIVSNNFLDQFQVFNLHLIQSANLVKPLWNRTVQNT